MLPCEEVRKLAEEYVSETLEPSRWAQVARHLQVCQECHQAVEEARLARRVLHDTQAPPPPPRLAHRIKLAACTRLSHRPRPLHERALGSPAFLATCASLLCGFVICLVAILKVAYVQPWPSVAPPDVSVVETYRLPAREVAPLAAPLRLATPTETRRAPAALTARRSAPLAAAPVSRALATPARPAPHAVAAPRPARGFMATAHAAPAMGVAAHLPSAIVSPAGVRISRPDSVLDALGVETVASPRPDRDDLEYGAVSPDGGRGDFTSSLP
jgi:hypothetical protein